MRLLLVFAVLAPFAESRLVAMMRNTTDPECLARRVPCSTLAAVDPTTGAVSPTPTTVRGLEFLQGLQVAAGGSSPVSYSIAIDYNATGQANTVLAGVDVATGLLVRRRRCLSTTSP